MASPVLAGEKWFVIYMVAKKQGEVNKQEAGMQLKFF